MSRDETEDISFTLGGERKNATTFGLRVSIIDFTLSRINTGTDFLSEIYFNYFAFALNGFPYNNRSEYLKKPLYWHSYVAAYCEYLLLLNKMFDGLLT